MATKSADVLPELVIPGSVAGGGIPQLQGTPWWRNGRFWQATVFYVVIGFFVANLVGMVASVVVDSFGTQWFASWLPDGLTTRWYQYVTGDHDIGGLLYNTLVVAVSTTVIALAVGFPAAYVLARKDFRFKAVLTGLYLVPMLLPPLVYGIPLATLLLKFLHAIDLQLGTSLATSLVIVIIINLVPVVPFVILILTPFIQQIDASMESASAMLGANRWQTFFRVLLPLVIPGLLTAGVLAIVRVVAMFELTYLSAGPLSQTLVVTLYGDAFASGIRPTQAVDGMAVIYMATSMALVGVALIFVKPTQFVVRVKTENK